jgi:hypothetical protein
MKINNSIFKTYSLSTTNNSTFNLKTFKKLKCNFNIQSSSQLKNYLYTENIFSLKIILMFLINATRQFSNNLILFYEIIINIIDKLNSSTNNNIKGDEYDKYYISVFISENKNILFILNKLFNDVYSQDTLEFYFFSKNKHNISVLLYMIMTGFTYYSFEIEKDKHPKKEIHKLLLNTKNKYLCNDNDKIFCQGCSLKSVDLINNYLKTIGKEFLETKNKKFMFSSERKPMKLKHNLGLSSSNKNIYFNDLIFNNIVNINNEINKLDKLISEEKNFLMKIKNELSNFKKIKI